MRTRRTFRRWLGMASSKAPEAPTDGFRMVAQPRTPGRARYRVRPWTEQPETCEVCGRRLLVGEVPALYQRDETIILACPVCATGLAAAGLRAPRTMPANGPAEELREVA
jgi:hypothetical protein